MRKINGSPQQMVTARRPKQNQRLHDVPRAEHPSHEKRVGVGASANGPRGTAGYPHLGEAVTQTDAFKKNGVRELLL